MKLSLKDVTICAADCVSTTLAARAIVKSMTLCDFGDSVLFANNPPNSSFFRSVKIEALNSRAEYSRFILKDLPNFVSTAFVLVVQWDGYVLEPKAWRESFFDFDLIGARWVLPNDGMTVGNGGFSLRSKKLIDAMGKETFPFVSSVNEDYQICRLYRSKLMADFGIRFAPERVADVFSYERALTDSPTFGFHGAFNLWRHVDDDEMLLIAAQVGPNVIRSMEFFELTFQYFRMNKLRPLRALYSRLRERFQVDEIRSVVTRIDHSNCADFVRVCEEII
jgi:hypothetical protein